MTNKEAYKLKLLIDEVEFINYQEGKQRRGLVIGLRYNSIKEIIVDVLYDDDICLGWHHSYLRKVYPC